MPLTYDREWVEFEKAMGEPPALPEDVEARIQVFNNMLAAMAQALPPTDADIRTHEVVVNEHVKARIYTPPTASGSPLPVVVFYHGGGWQAGNLDTEDHTCRVVCTGVNCIVVSCDYRKGPKYKFPTPIDDAYAGYHWARNNASSIGGDANKCIVFGGSAGGSLAISVVYRALQQGEPAAGLVAMQPMSLHPDATPAEYKDMHKSYVENIEGAVVSGTDAMRAFETLDALPPYQDSSWFPQSLGKEGVKGFPPTYIVNTDVECFRDDGAVLEQELKEAGTGVRRDVIVGFPHYFWVFPIVEGGKLFRAKLVEGIKWVVDARNL